MRLRHTRHTDIAAATGAGAGRRRRPEEGWRRPQEEEEEEEKLGGERQRRWKRRRRCRRSWSLAGHRSRRKLGKGATGDGGEEVGAKGDAGENFDKGDGENKEEGWQKDRTIVARGVDEIAEVHGIVLDVLRRVVPRRWDGEKVRIAEDHRASVLVAEFRRKGLEGRRKVRGFVGEARRVASGHFQGRVFAIHFGQREKGRVQVVVLDVEKRSGFRGAVLRLEDVHRFVHRRR
mmetsp:Transcript_6662/g.17421  ORF Transcript_6662/g.17421 Transcript_6662/m.17421 type:complete len:233 (-) Transcript_6662:107-805(-)